MTAPSAENHGSSTVDPLKVDADLLAQWLLPDNHGYPTVDPFCYPCEPVEEALLKIKRHDLLAANQQERQRRRGDLRAIKTAPKRSKAMIRWRFEPP